MPAAAEERLRSAPGAATRRAPLVFLIAFATLAPARAEEDVTAPGEGEVVALGTLERLRPFLPEPLWEHRHLFFYDGMRLEIGPVQADYRPNDVFVAATRRFRGEARIGPEAGLEGYVAGWPFDPDAIDCAAPGAGARIAWNLATGPGDRTGSFRFTTWRRGLRVPPTYEGTWHRLRLAHRFEPRYLEVDPDAPAARGPGDVFHGEKPFEVLRVDVERPEEVRGIQIVAYRYKSALGPPSEAKDDDAWVYLPRERRVRRVSSPDRTDPLAETAFSFEELGGFAGVVPRHGWTCLGEVQVLAVVNTREKAFPDSPERDFGPYGLSFADDRWELRSAYVLRMVPRDDAHPYRHKDLYVDQQTFAPLYAFAYGRDGRLWRIVWNVHRWSGDTSLTGVWFPGWDQVPEPRALVLVGEVVADVQTASGVRIESWDAHTEWPASRGALRQLITGVLRRRGDR